MIMNSKSLIFRDDQNPVIGFRRPFHKSISAALLRPGVFPSPHQYSENTPAGAADAGRRGRMRAILLKFNPKLIFYDRPKEDLATFRAARSIKDRDIAGEPEVVAAKIDAKFLGALAFGEVCGTCFGAPSVGIALQEFTHNAYLGVAGTIIGDYFPAVFGFQAAWLALNRGYYRHGICSFWGGVKKFYKDVLPVHAAAAVAAVPAYIVGGILSAGAVALADFLVPGRAGAEKLHFMPIISEVINFGIVETIYLTLLAGQALDMGRKISGRYLGYLKDRYGAKPG